MTTEKSRGAAAASATALAPTDAGLLATDAPPSALRTLAVSHHLKSSVGLMDLAAESAALGQSRFAFRRRTPPSSASFTCSSRAFCHTPIATLRFPSLLSGGRLPLMAGFCFSPGLRPSCDVGVVKVRAFDGMVGRGGRKGVAVSDKRVPFVLSVLLGAGAGVMLAGVALALFVTRCQAVFAAEGVFGASFKGLGLRNDVLKRAWPKILQVLSVFKEQGLILAGLLALSAFFSMAETSITTLWPWKVRELAEKESENGVFRILRSDVNRFLTTILIGTTVANIGATALVTEAATTLFGEAGVSAATGVMTVAILLLTEITPKSIAVHNATEVARICVRPVAWLSVVLYPLGKAATYLSMGIQKMLGLRARSEPYVTEDELKLMLRGAELSGAIEEEEQDMIENVLEIKDTHVREVMTPLVDVVAIDASSKLIDFQKLWVTHQYSRVPVFEQRIDNIVGIAYAMDMLEYVEKVDQLGESTVGDIAHKPTYFVPDSMSVWNLLREFRIRKVHMAVVLNEYGGTVGIVTLEDVVEEIVGEIFDENDSKEEIQKKTGFVVMLEDGSYGVDANTSMDQLSEELNVKIPESHQYETVSGFICESFGCIPNKGDKMKVILEKANQEENNEYAETEPDHEEGKAKHQIFELEILEASARKVESVLFRPINDACVDVDGKGANRIISTKVIKRKRINSGNEDSSEDDVPSSTEGQRNDYSDEPSLHEIPQDRHKEVSISSEEEFTG